MSLRALIFDVDGTLADTEELHRKAFNLAFAAHHLGWYWSPSLYAQLLKTTGGKERLAAYIASLPIKPEQAAALHQDIPNIHRDKTTFYTEMVHDGRLPLRPGVRRLIEQARAQGLRLAIASTTTLANIEALLQSTFGKDGLAVFDAIAAGDQVTRKKPAPDIFELALRRLGLPATDCIAIEDSNHGLCAAKAAGLWTLVTPNFWTAGQDFNAADLLLDSIGDDAHPLPGADQERIGATQLELPTLQSHFAAPRPGAVA
jgi:HAD superfamily hydrolase (TIGR01509 family)